MSDFVSFEIAKKLKEKGYPQNNCFRCYFVGDDKVRGCSVGGVIHRSHKGEKHLIAAPAISQVLKWLKERVTFPYEGGCDENGNPLAMDYIEWRDKVNENSDLFIKKFKEAMEEQQ